MDIELNTGRFTSLYVLGLIINAFRSRSCGERGHTHLGCLGARVGASHAGLIIQNCAKMPPPSPPPAWLTAAFQRKQLTDFRALGAPPCTSCNVLSIPRAIQKWTLGNETLAPHRNALDRPWRDTSGRTKLVWLHIPKTGSTFKVSIWMVHCPPEQPLCDLFSQRDAKLLTPARAINNFSQLSSATRDHLNAHCRFTDLRNPAGAPPYPGLQGHQPWDRAYAPHGVVLLRDPRSRLLSAFRFRDGHIEPPQLHAYKWWWRGNLSRYARFPGIAGAQSKMVLGLDAFEPAEALVRTAAYRVRACRILLEDFRYIGLTEEYNLSVRLYHAMHRKPPGAACPRAELAVTRASEETNRREAVNWHWRKTVDWERLLRGARKQQRRSEWRHAASRAGGGGGSGSHGGGESVEAAGEGGSEGGRRGGSASAQLKPAAASPEQQLERAGPALMAGEPDTTTHACGAVVFWHRVCHVYRLLPLSDARCEGSATASFLRRRVQRHLRAATNLDPTRNGSSISMPTLDDEAERAVAELMPVLGAFIAWDAVRYSD